jgi:tetratricopeptide (TPR) repeat protein
LTSPSIAANTIGPMNMPVTAQPAIAAKSAGGAIGGTTPRADRGAPIDDEIDRMFAERRARLSMVSTEGPRMLRVGNWQRAAELCKAWAELEPGNVEALRCVGSALQAQGLHQDAIAAFNKAKQYDPADRTLDAAIEQSQKGLVADFLGRYRK